MYKIRIVALHSLGNKYIKAQEVLRDEGHTRTQDRQLTKGQ